jgi:serine/threonine-protein kinase RsbW
MKKETISIPSDRKNIHAIERFVEDICDYYNINNTYFGNILVALMEAVENAIIHGNNNDPSKTVTVNFEARETGLSFEVIDQGTGFDFSAVPDPTDIFKSTGTEGTGIFLIRSLADNVNFHDNGRRIELIFLIASINQLTYLERMKHFNEYSKTSVKKEEKEKNQGS